MSTAEPVKPAFVKGLDGVVAAQTMLSSVDGQNGVLTYRGINIHELAEKASYEEVVYLLWYGKLPTRRELADLEARLAAQRTVPDQILNLLRDLQELRRVVEPAGVRLAAERATAQDIAEIETAYAGMKDAIDNGGDYVKHDLLFHQGLLRACHNRMVVQMSKALGALLRTSFEISTSRPDGPASSLPLHRAVLDAVIARSPQKAEKAILVLIDGARDDIEQVLASRRKLPSLAAPALRLKGRNPAIASR